MMYVVTSPMATRAAWNSTHSPTPVGTHLSWWKPHAWLRLAGTGCPAVSSHLNARLVNVKMNKLIIKTGWDMMGLYIVIVAIIPIIVVIYGLYDGIYIYISISGCWFQPTPPKNDGLRQLGFSESFPTVSGKSFKIPWFQSPPTSG